MNESIKDAELAQRILVKDSQAKSSEAFRMIYERHSGAVLALSKRVLRNQQLAEEVTQEVFVQLWNKPDRFDPARGNLRTYLMTMAHGRSVDVVRSESSRKTREERDSIQAPVATAGVDEAVGRSLEDESVRAALSQLPEEQRKPIELAYFGGLTYREVATELRQPEGTVKSRIRIGMTSLAKSLGQAT